MLHPDAERITAAMVSEVFSYDLRFAVTAPGSPVSSYSEAFRASRGKGEDYFALVSFRENDRDIQITLDLYVSKTGSRAETFSVFRTGNDRYSNALRRLVQTVAAAMPVRGAVSSRYQTEAVIDLGKSDALAAGTVFDIVPSSAVTVKNEGIGLQYDQAQVLGSFTVTAVDEDVSQGTLARNGFFDRVNAGDAAIPAQEKTEGAKPAEAERSTAGWPALLSLLRKIR